MARLDGETRAGSAAPDRLLELAADAEQRQWLVWSVEAKLMASEPLRARGSSAARVARCATRLTKECVSAGSAGS